MPTAVVPRLDRVVPIVVGATVLAFAAGSSSVDAVLRVGHSLRWAMLLVLLLCAAAWALPRATPPRTATWAASALVALALLSTAWSVEPRTTFERSVSLGLLFATCLALAAAVRTRPGRVESVLAGVLGGAVAVTLAGLVLLAADHGAAVVGATYESPARYRGFGQDPNTVALLCGVAAPIALWFALNGRRLLGGAALLLLGGTIVASGSRGGLLSAGIGCAVVALVLVGRTARGAVVVLAAVAVAVAIGGAVQSIPSPSAAGAGSAHAPAPAPGPTPKPGYLDAEATYPLDADVGQPLPGGGQPPVRRSLFGSSGRVDAWTGALQEAARRPVAGHGFGTEQAVFVDRYYRFVGGLPENSYIGLALQLGLAGLLALAALVVVLARANLRAPQFSAVGLGVLAAGLAAAVAQSYLYSVGNIAAAAFWIPPFVVAALADA